MLKKHTPIEELQFHCRIMMPIPTLVLPGAPEVLPADLHIQTNLSHLDGIEPTDASAFHAAALGLTNTPQLLIGGPHTPASLWLLAVEHFPHAGHWLCTSPTPDSVKASCWLKRGAAVPLSSAKDVLGSVVEKPLPPPRESRATGSNRTKDDAQPPAFKMTPKPVTSTQSPTESHADNYADWPDGKLIAETFKYSAWGNAPEHIRIIQAIEQAALRRNYRQTGLLSRLQNARNNGLKAHDIWIQMEKRLKQEGESRDLMSWMDNTLGQCHESIHTHINIQLVKWRKWRQSQQEKAAKQTKSRRELPPITWREAGHHPNSVQTLRPAHRWEILIDETGSTFDHQAEALSIHDAQLGRVIAVVVPHGCKLPAIPHFHATDATDEAINEALSSLLTLPIGIFGFNVKDNASIGIHWLSHIRQLIRWTLLQLPYDGTAPMEVSCLVEQRGAWAKRDLGALEELISSELIALDAERYQDLKLQIRLIGKQDDPRIGYADAVAWCWGSPSRAAKEKLRHTHWERHCLLRPDHEAMERIYLALNRQARLSATDWYRLCSAIVAEQGQGVLHRFLQELGQACQQDRARWQHYLDEVKFRLSHKQYQLAELSAALEWLDHYKPEGCNFPLELQLQLALEQLALANHRGQIDLSDYRKVIQLADSLYEENAPTACHALLRVATMGTNYFDFHTIQDELTRWLSEPVAVVGRLNHAKLLSTQGQLHAFRGEHDAAQCYFAQALAAYDQLSDQQQAHREKQQTGCYILISKMDHLAAPHWLPALQDYLQSSLNKQGWNDIARSLAHSGQGRRFEHHLFLRACIRAPSELMSAWQAYLELRTQWQQESDHPWPLINAYRAWLLQGVDEKRAAEHYLQMAVDQCADPDNGSTLHWMALVLERLALALGVPVSQESIETNSLRQQLPLAPHSELDSFDSLAVHQQRDHRAMQTLLQRCLPFNFH